MPEALIRAVEDAGILEPARDGGEVALHARPTSRWRAPPWRCSASGCRWPSCSASRSTRPTTTRDVVDRAIDLFDRHVRRDTSGAERPADEVVETFRRMLPAVTTLVAHHFQRTLCRARSRASSSSGTRTACGTRSPPRDSGRLEVTWR